MSNAIRSVLANQHKKANKNYLTANDFTDEILLSYPVKPEKLDVFTLFLNKGNYQPKNIKQVSNSHMILQMVAADMGIATLPHWLVASLTKKMLVKSVPLGKQGVFKILYARYSNSNQHIKVIQQLLPLVQASFISLDKSIPDLDLFS